MAAPEAKVGKQKERVEARRNGAIIRNSFFILQTREYLHLRR
jgi:hypothetical protein